MAMDAFSASLMKDKREIVIAPTIYKFDTFDAFAEEFQLGERDVVLTNEFIYKPFMEKLGLKSNFVFQEKFGALHARAACSSRRRRPSPSTARARCR